MTNSTTLLTFTDVTNSTKISKKMKNITLLFLFLMPHWSFAQPAELSIFDNLVSKTWKAEGFWGDGSQFKQEVKFDYALDSTIVIASSFGFTNEAQTEYGLRNHGIRQFDSESGQLKFWEFDVFGGRTEGIIFTDDKNIFYLYEYGGTTVTDLWTYVDELTYSYKVGIYENNQWKQTFLDTKFTGTNREE